VRLLIRIITIVQCLLLGACFQAQLNGPVAGSSITVTDLRDDSLVYAQVDASSSDTLREFYGVERWEGFGPQRRLWLLGVFQLQLQDLDDDTLYLVTAAGGEDADNNRDGLEDDSYRPVAGSWRAIMSGAQLKDRGPKVSALTEAAWQWLAPHLDSLSDRQLSHNLDRAAAALLADLNRDNRSDRQDLALWNRLLDANRLLVDPQALNQLSENIIAGEPESERAALAGQLIGLEIDTGVPPNLPAADTLDEQLRGLSLVELLEVSYRALLLRHPEWILDIGETELYGLETPQLNDISDAYSRETFDVIEVILDRLNGFNPALLSEEDRLSLEIYRWYLEDWLAQEPWLLYNYPASSFITGVPRQTSFLFSDILPLDDADDARVYVNLLGQVGEKFAQLRENVSARAEAGIIEPRITLDLAIDGLRFTARTRASSTSYYQRLSNALGGIDGLSTDEQLQLRETALDVIENQVQPAYDGLRSDLIALQQRAPDEIGFGQFENGREFYAWALRHHNTTDMTATEVHQEGLQELARVQQEIRSKASALGYSNSLPLPELFAQLEFDSGILSGTDILDTYVDILDVAYLRLDEAFSTLPQQELVVIGGPTGGFYVSGSDDGSRPGAFYAQTVGDEPYLRMRSLAYHEGVPGHHLQLALAQEQDLPAFQRYTTYTGYTEGWALYAERLAADLGWYEGDPYGDLGRLQFEAIRAARLVVDTGIHDLGWSWDEAVNYWRNNTGSSLGASQGSVARFMRWPGQATAYLIGMNKILALRTRMQSARGEDYDIKEFHELVLRSGAVPLAILETVIDDAVAP